MLPDLDLHLRLMDPNADPTYEAIVHFHVYYFSLPPGRQKTVRAVDVVFLQINL
jgi:hypothetical protein